MKSKKILKRFVLLPIFVFFPVVTSADTVTTNMTVTATVLKTCSVSTTPLTFGNYDPGSVSATDSTATVTVTCNNSTTYDVGLDAGGGSGASTTTRKLTYLTNTIDYQLFRDSGRSQNWGNTISTDTLNATGTGNPVNHTVYGRIPSGQFVANGNYVDTVTITVTY